MAENTGIFSGNICAFKSCRAGAPSGVFGFAVFEGALNMRRQFGPAGQ